MATFFIVLCAAFAVLFAWLAIAIGLRAGRTRSWPRVEGRVLSTGITIALLEGEASHGDIDAYERRYRPNVNYEYVVGGETYFSSQIAPDMAKGFLGERRATQLIERYPAGSAVGVHHDPRDPAQAVLEPGASRITVGTICVLVVMAALCVTIAVLIETQPPSIPEPDYHTPN